MALLDLIGDSTPPKKSGTVFDLIRETPEQEQAAADKIRARYERLNKPQPAASASNVGASNEAGEFLRRLAHTIPPRSSSVLTAPKATFNPKSLLGQRYDFGIDQKNAQPPAQQQEEPHEFQGETNSVVGDALSGTPAGLLMKFASLNPVTAGITRAGVAGLNSFLLGIPSAIAPESYSAVQRQLSTGSKTGDFAADLSGNLSGSVGGLTALTKLGLSSSAAFVMQGLPSQTSQVIRGEESVPEAALHLGADYATGKLFEAAKPLASELLPEGAGQLRKVVTNAMVQAPVGATQSLLQSTISGKSPDYGDVATNALIAGGFGASEAFGDVRSNRVQRRAAADEFVKGDIGDRMLQAIGMYEQRTNDPSNLALPRALKSDSGQAAGFAQLTPENIATYSEQVLGKRLNKRQFKELSYADQYKVARAMSDGILSKNIQRYGDVEKAMDATAIEWFGGPAGRRKWERGKSSRVSDGHDTGDKYIAGVREKLALLQNGKAQENVESLQPTDAPEEQPQAAVEQPAPTQENTPVEQPVEDSAPTEPLPLPESVPVEGLSVEEGQPALVSPTINEQPLLEDYATGGEEPTDNLSQYPSLDEGVQANGENWQYNSEEQGARTLDSYSDRGDQSGTTEETRSVGSNEPSRVSLELSDLRKGARELLGTSKNVVTNESEPIYAIDVPRNNKAQQAAFQELLDKGYISDNLTLTDKGRSAHNERVRIADGVDISERRPTKGLPSKTDWTGADINGESIYGTSAVLIRGEAPSDISEPKDLNGNPLPSDSVKFDKLFDASKNATPLEEIAYTRGTNDPYDFSPKNRGLVWFNEGTAVDEKYYDTIKNKYPDVTFHARTDGPLLNAMRGDELVGVIAPVRVKPTSKIQEIISKRGSGVIEEQPREGLNPPMKDSRLAPPGSLQSVVIPGAESAVEVFQKDVAPAIRSAALAVREASQDIHKILSPSSRGDEAEQTKLIMRDRLSELAMQNDRAESALSDARKAMDQLPTEAKYDFIDRVERGGAQATPELTEISKNLRRLLEERKDAIQALGTGKLQSVIENYFPHIWENPEQARDAFAQAYSKRPFEGSKSFLKQRSIDYFKEGLGLGLKPVTDNPVDLTILKLREMDRYLMAHKVMGEMKDQGLLKFFPATEQIPEGYSKIDDKIGTVYGSPEAKIPLKTISAIEEQIGASDVNAKAIREGLGESATVSAGGFPIVGYYAAPEKAALLINNYLSPGLREKSALFRGYLSTANSLNQFQLGYSAFHLGFTSMDAITSQFALGVYKGVHGDIAEGAKTIATAIFAPARNFRQGSKLLSEWLKPGSQGEEIGQIVDALQKGGGRAKMDTFYKTTAADNVKKVWKETDHLLAKIFRTSTRLPFAATELAAKPIMEYLVPRMKLGAFFQMAEYELSRSKPALDAMEPKARTAEIRRLMSNAWDSVDNRMGQLVYDNLFWNKATKDLAMASVRSVGWNLGTFRELGGGLIDYGRAIKSLAKRERVEFTHRMAYVAALPIVTGMAGAIFQYLFTGKAPQELKDYFFPQDGGIDEHGNPTRVSLPSYMKDIYAYYKDVRDAATIGGNPARTLVAKTHPLIAVIGEMLENKDFYGTKIRNEDDPFMQQALDALGHLATVFVPFGARGIARNVDLEGVSIKTFLPEIGITPAPSDLNKSEAQKLMSKYIEESLPQGARTSQATERSNARRSVIRRLRMGEQSEALTEFRQQLQSGKLAPEDSKTILRDAKQTPLQSGFKRLEIDKAINVYNAATPEERKELRPLLGRKWQSKKPGSIPPEQYLELRRRLQESLQLEVAR